MRRVLPQEAIDALTPEALKNYGYYWEADRIVPASVGNHQGQRLSQYSKEIRLSYRIKATQKIEWVKELDWSLRDTAIKIRRSYAYGDQLGRTRANLRNKEECIGVMKKVVRAYKQEIGALPGHANYDPLVKASFPVRTAELAKVLAWLKMRQDVKEARREAKTHSLAAHNARTFHSISDAALNKLYSLKGWNRPDSVSSTLAGVLELRIADRKRIDSQVRKNLWKETGNHKQGDEE